MPLPEDPPAGAPEWIVTFGDMMALLLTFFIMLVSMSELKEEEEYRAMMDSIRRQFGHDASKVVPDDIKAVNASLPLLASMGRSKRLDLMRGGPANSAISGERPLVQTGRPGHRPTASAVVYFPEELAQLTPAMRDELRQLATNLSGKPQKIEIRGHTSRKPPDPHLDIRDSWDLGYARAHSTMQYLIAAGIEPRRIRIGSAGAFEPLDKGVDSAGRGRNARVEVLLWDEHASLSE